MSTTPNIQYTNEETLALISEKAKASGNPRFTLNIRRRRPGAIVTEGICTLADASVEHIANMEQWLPLLVGGGEYLMGVSHPDEPAKRIGGYLLAAWDSKVYPPKTPSPQTLRLAEWAGPTSMLFPNEQSASVQSAGAQFPGVQILQGNALPTTQVPNQLNERVVYQTDPNIEQKRRDLEERESSVRRVETETKINFAVESARREFAAQLAELKAAQQPRPPDRSNIDLAIAIAPLVQGYLASQNESRKADADRQAKLVEIQMAQAQAHQQVMMTLFERMSQKPGMSEETKLLFETLKSNASGSGTAEMMTQMVNAMGAVSKTTLGMMEAMADLNGGAEESPVVGAVREAAKAIGSLMQGAENGARKVIQQQRGPTPQLPPVQQPRQQAQPPQQRAPAPQPAQARPQAPQSAQAPAQAPVPVVVYAPTGPEPIPNQPQAFDGVNPPPTAQPEPVVPQPSSVDQIEMAIRAHHNHEEVAQVFVKLIAEKDPALVAELETHDHDPNNVIGARLGAWVFETPNREYLEKLGSAVDKYGADAGIWESDEPSEEGASAT